MDSVFLIEQKPVEPGLLPLTLTIFVLVLSLTITIFALMLSLTLTIIVLVPASPFSLCAPRTPPGERNGCWITCPQVAPSHRLQSQRWSWAPRPHAAIVYALSFVFACSHALVWKLLTWCFIYRISRGKMGSEKEVRRLLRITDGTRRDGRGDG